jgi:flagellar motility protein MotE (MotC chaperone)
MKLFRVRLLPVTLVVLFMVLGVRVNNLFEENGQSLVALPQANAAADAEQKVDEESDGAKPEGDEATSEDVEDSDAPARGSLASRDPTTFSPSEIALLENLARRRDEIEKRADSLEVRESLLVATETRIDEKIGVLKSLEERIDALVKQHGKAEEARIGKLVVVYEKMKPKDAARIFDQIDLDILLEVTGRMKEAKVAEVLAKMSSERAQELTIALATREDLDAQVER